MKKNRKILRSVIVTAFVLSLFLSSGPIFAKENGREDGKKESRKENVGKKDDKDKNKNKDDQDRNWSFGRFFAPGQVKKDGNTFNQKDFMTAFREFLAQYRQNHPVPSTTPDTVVPVISNIRVAVERNQATIRFSTNEKTDSAVFFGIISPVDTSSSSVAITGNTRSLNHEIVLKNLNASTTYYFVARARDVSGNVSLSVISSFQTKPLVTSVDTAVPKISNVYTTVGTSSATINWLTNEPTTSKIFYSTNLPIDTQSSSTARVENTSLITAHSLVISNLATSTKYYFAIEAKDLAGNLKRSLDYYVVTPAN